MSSILASGPVSFSRRIVADLPVERAAARPGGEVAVEYIARQLLVCLGLGEQEQPVGKIVLLHANERAHGILGFERQGLSVLPAQIHLQPVGKVEPVLVIAQRTKEFSRPGRRVAQ